MAESLGLDRGTKGAVITDVVDGQPGRAGGPASPGDVIVEVDRRPVGSAEEAVARASRRREGGGHLLRVRGPNGTRFVTVK